MLNVLLKCNDKHHIFCIDIGFLAVAACKQSHLWPLNWVIHQPCGQTRDSKGWIPCYRRSSFSGASKCLGILKFMLIFSSWNLLSAQQEEDYGLQSFWLKAGRSSNCPSLPRIDPDFYFLPLGNRCPGFVSVFAFEQCLAKRMRVARIVLLQQLSQDF